MTKEATKTEKFPMLTHGYSRGTGNRAGKGARMADEQPHFGADGFYFANGRNRGWVMVILLRCYAAFLPKSTQPNATVMTISSFVSLQLSLTS